MTPIKQTFSTLPIPLLAVALLLLLLQLPSVVVAADGAASAESFEALAGELAGGNFRQRAETAARLAETGHPRAGLLLEGLLEGRLYAEGASPARLLLVDDGESPQAVDPFSGAALGPLSDFEARRVSVNNSLRGKLRNLIARLNLFAANSEVRLAAARQLMGSSLDDELAALLTERVASEQDGEVRSALETALALRALSAADPADRLAAIERLQGSLQPEVPARLTALSADDPAPEVKRAAAAALKQIASRVEFYKFLESVFFGLSLGSVLLLAAVGLAITFGVMGVINMAHGEFMMLGAYTTWGVQQLLPGQLETSLLLAVPAAFLVAGLVGVAIERGVIRFLYGRPLETLLATFGISLVLQQTVRSIFSPLNRSVSSPSWLSGSLQINPVLSLTYNRLYILVFALLVFFALLAVLKRTSLGLKVRAVSQNRGMARACGVRADRVDALTFGLGAGIAGVAGVALSQLTNVGPNLGQAYIIDSFMVVVFGGVGNLWGTLVGAMGLGIANKFLEPQAGAVLAKILVLAFIILFIQKRPRGLFPQKGRAVEG